MNRSHERGERATQQDTTGAHEAPVLRSEAAQLITAEQLADRWQVKPSHIYRLTRDKRIPAVRLGRYYRYRLDAIERFEQGGGDGEADAA